MVWSHGMYGMPEAVRSFKRFPDAIDIIRHTTSVGRTLFNKHPEFQHPRMAGIPSVQDILMLAGIAWKIGRAFTNGRKGAPAEFQSVKSEAEALSQALQLLADAFSEDGGMLENADASTKNAVTTILQSAQTTLDDLDSLVERYQVIKKSQTEGGWVVEKSWRDAVLKNWRTIIWTTERGSIQDLRAMLQMHSSTINLTMQAMQSGSLRRLEKTVLPMAGRVDEIHHAVHGSLSEQLNDIHRVIMAVADATPSLRAHRLETQAEVQRPPLSLPPSGLSALPPAVQESRISDPPSLSWSSTSPASEFSDASPRTRQASLARPLGQLPFEEDQHGTSWFAIPSDADPFRALSGCFEHWSLPQSAATTERIQDISARPRSLARRDSETIPSDALLGVTSAEAQQSLSSSPATPSSFSMDRGAVAPPQPVTAPPPRPSTPPRSSQRRQSQTSTLSPSSPLLRHGSAATEAGPHSAFERPLFRNSVRLFEGEASLIELTQLNPDAPDPRYELEMRELATDARVYVVRRCENLPNGGHTYATSIWTIADDFSVRAQHRLPETPEPVPYASVFDAEKTSLDGEIVLQLHSAKWGEQCISELKTGWVNYVFRTQEAACAFQSAVFGRRLLDSFRTEKTCVLHEGLRGTFAFEEQLAGIESLRLWEEDGVTMPGAAGGVMALLHLSSSFGDGWIRWWINDTRQPMRVKSESAKVVKIKGLDVAVARIKPGGGGQGGGGGSARRDSAVGQRRWNERRLPGMKMEFSTEEEKKRFLGLVRRAQMNMVALPDI